VAKQGYLAPNDPGGAGSQVAFSYCRSLYALALFPPKLSSHTELIHPQKRLISLCTNPVSISSVPIQTVR
jgi:hypothetical protein